MWQLCLGMAGGGSAAAELPVMPARSTAASRGTLLAGSSHTELYASPSCNAARAGQGTCGSEILRQTDMDNLDYIFVGIGALVGDCKALLAPARRGLRHLRHYMHS